MAVKPGLHHSFINPHAHGIVRTLQDKGHETYLVGGCVRDLLAGMIPKDFDIATTARPNQVKRLIRHSYVIGKRFRLVLVKRENLQLEVATFRRNITEDDNQEELPGGDNSFGSPQEDANRRDFTINGLFYDPIKDQLIDYCDGLKDLESRTVRMIGDPNIRLLEDPIRILRAIRLAHKLNFSIDSHLRHNLEKYAHSLQESVLPRRREEFLKLLKLPDPSRALIEAYDLKILKAIAPQLHNAMENEAFVDELCEFHIRHIEDSPLVLFSQLIHAYYRCIMAPSLPSDSDASLSTPHAYELLKDKNLLTLMRNELGMFKQEQELAIKSIQMQTLLSRKKQLEKKGLQRLLTIVHNAAYPLAISFAKVNLNLGSQDIFFWENLYEAHLHTPSPSAPYASSRHRRRRSRRKKRKK